MQFHFLLSEINMWGIGPNTLKAVILHAVVFSFHSCLENTKWRQVYCTPQTGRKPTGKI